MCDQARDRTARDTGALLVKDIDPLARMPPIGVRGSIYGLDSLLFFDKLLMYMQLDGGKTHLFGTIQISIAWFGAPLFG